MRVDLLDVSSLDAAVPHGALPGELLAGKYRVERVLGRGGMGVVVLARNVRLGQHVAIKFLGREPTRELSTRLLDEARAVARIASDHVVRVFDIAELADGAPYIVMEYLEGECLDRVLRRAGRLPWVQATHWVLEACEGLAMAHHHAIVHRDLKPANLFLEQRRDGSRRIKVLDFGVAKLGPGLGNTTHPVGSPAYMAPEQLESCRDIDARADIWGIGIVLYELVTGSTPYRASSLLGLALEVREAAHVPAIERCPELPPGLSDVIERCLRKRREERFASVRELVLALCAFAPAGAAISSRVDGLAAAARAAASRSPAEPRDSEGDDAGRDRGCDDRGREDCAGDASCDDRYEAGDVVPSAAGEGSEHEPPSRSRNLPGLATTLAGPAPRTSGARLAPLAAIAAVVVLLAAAAAWHPERAAPSSHGGSSDARDNRSTAALLPASSAAPEVESAALDVRGSVGAPSAELAPMSNASADPPTESAGRRATSSAGSAHPAAPSASHTARSAQQRSSSRASSVEAAPTRPPPSPVSPAAAPSVPTAAPSLPAPGAARSGPIPVGPLPLDRELSW